MGIFDQHVNQLLSGSLANDTGIMALFDDLDVGIVLLDSDLRLRYQNRTAQAWNTQSADPPGTLWREVAAKAFPAELVTHMQKTCLAVLDDGRPRHESAWRVPDPSSTDDERWLDWSIYRLRGADSAPQGLVLSLNDVTKHVASRQALEAQRQLLRTIVDSIPAALAYVDRDLRYVFANTGYQDLVGIDPTTIIGARVEDILGKHAFEQLHPVLIRALAGETISCETDLSLAGQPTRHLHRQYIPHHRLDGTIDGFVVLAQDFSAHHQMQMQLERKNRELEQFAGMAAHDLQAPLRQVSLQADLLIHDAEKTMSQGQREALHRMKDGLLRMNALVQALLLYARSGASDATMVLIPLTDPLDVALTNLDSDIRQRSALIDYPPDLPTIRCEPSLLTQVFQNLISNAIKFCDHEPKLVIDHRRWEDAHEIRLHDNGIGVPEDRLDYIFGSFTRLEQGHHPGTGLGLASCRKIVELHGGRIWAEAPPEGGTVIAFTLPAAGTSGHAVLPTE